MTADRAGLPRAGAAVLRPAGVAHILGVSIETVIGWITSGKLPALNVATRTRRATYRIARRDLRAFLVARGLPTETVLDLFP